MRALVLVGPVFRGLLLRDLSRHPIVVAVACVSGGRGPVREAGAYGKVRMTGPSAVMATVCSTCTLLLPSPEHTDQPSSAM